MNITLIHSKGEINIPEVKVRRGIYQGDSLSPLLFCIAIDPLSKLIKKENIGYSLGKSRKKEDKIKDLTSHLLFMDDLKLYAEEEKGLARLLKIVHNFSNDIGMEFGLDKCAKCTIKKGEKTEGIDFQIDEGQYIKELENDAVYTYLGIEENASLQHKHLRTKAKKEYIRRLKKICRSQLSPRNKITAINQMATPVLAYGFGIIDWPKIEINSIDTKTRKILTMNKIIYRNQCLDRIYLPRREGGMGLIEINDAYRNTIINLDFYLKTTNEKHLKMYSCNTNKIFLKINLLQSWQISSNKHTSKKQNKNKIQKEKMHQKVTTKQKSHIQNIPIYTSNE